MKIVTIGREFGSGGREIGKRLADILGFDYYDREIISSLSSEEEYKASFYNDSSDVFSWQSVPITFRHSFAVPMIMNQPQTQMILEQKRVIESIAEKGRDCIFVGRNADVILGKYDPFKIFVCADLEAKLTRCEERASAGEKLSRKQLEHNMRRIDKNRATAREFICDLKWGEPSSYNMTINTTDWDIKVLSNALAGIINCYFGEK